MAVLLIGDKEKAEINRAIERARKHPVPLAAVRQGAVADKETVKLTDRKPGWQRLTARPQQVLLPIGYRAAVSFEEQPIGLCMHLSISVERADPKWMPSPESVKMIASEFGIDIDYAVKAWMEEYEPGRHAVNILAVTTPSEEGHA